MRNRIDRKIILERNRLTKKLNELARKLILCDCGCTNDDKESLKTQIIVTNQRVSEINSQIKAHKQVNNASRFKKT